tara:strand:- start:664 stop:1740 length:1077 start_codon:yes stop_codon:yes gene_type:complete
MKKILIVTGGSGGHVIPSLSIYDHLKDFYEITIVTDLRGSKFINKDKYKFILIDVPNLFSKIYLIPLNFFNFLYSIFKSYLFLRKKNINFIISTGGYMSLPICIVSRFLGINIFLFEPNNVLGRSNRFMLNIAKKIICYNKEIHLFPKNFINKIYLISPILRKEIYFHAKNQKEEFQKVKKILITGGSQGAIFFDKNLTEVIIKVSKQLQIQVYQQVFDKNEKNLIEKKYQKTGIKHKIFHFDDNIFANLNDVDLAITRSGASSISELSCLKIPFIAIPFPFARDNHQYFNAKYYEDRNCCWIIQQKNFNLEAFSEKLVQILNKKTDYFQKKENLKKISNQMSWNDVNKKLLYLINEN